MNYSKEVLEQFGLWIDGDNSAGSWLNLNGYNELTKLKDAVSRDVKSLEYLFINKHFTLAAFVNAVWEDNKAFEILLKTRNHHWAAMANYINGDSSAAQFLKKNNLDHYLQIAIKLQAKLRKEGDQATSIFNSPIK